MSSSKPREAKALLLGRRAGLLLARGGQRLLAGGGWPVLLAGGDWAAFKRGCSLPCFHFVFFIKRGFELMTGGEHSPD
jgi:hypothetical protein